MRHIRLVATAAMCFVSAWAPSPAHAQAPARGGLDTVRFAQSLGVDLGRSRATPSGAYWRELVPGTGAEARRLSTATVRYRVARPDGTKVGADSTFAFRVGAGAAMPGFDESVRGMKVGGRRQLVVPRKAQGASAGEPLIFSVELVAVR